MWASSWLIGIAMYLDSGDSFHECEIPGPLGLERMAGSGSLGAGGRHSAS